MSVWTAGQSVHFRFVSTRCYELLCCPLMASPSPARMELLKSPPSVAAFGSDYSTSSGGMTSKEKRQATKRSTKNLEGWQVKLQQEHGDETSGVSRTERGLQGELVDVFLTPQVQLSAVNNFGRPRSLSREAWNENGPR